MKEIQSDAFTNRHLMEEIQSDAFTKRHLMKEIQSTVMNMVKPLSA